MRWPRYSKAFEQATFLWIIIIHLLDLVLDLLVCHIEQVAAPNMALKVLDMAMQVHGGAGLSSDTVLSHLWATARTLRIADGPDEVHLGTIAKLELQRAKL